MRPAAVLFDCDGVIVDSEPIGFDLLEGDLAAHGLPMPRGELERRFIGDTIRGLWQKATALGAALPEAWIDEFYERLYARLAEGTPLVPGITDVLDRLDRAGIPYAVGSNGTVRKMTITIGQHPDLWGRLRERLFSGQELGCPKPAPGLYLHAAQALGVDPAACVVVEDSPTGARAARNAGMRCLGLDRHGDGSALAAEGAEVFSRMDALPGLIGL